ncbi:MAG: hypothetical protein FWF30_02895, partial [Coriobacteriia bacterium]|nr:hypothetical protein [Coriobacteriia bacterium]
AREPQVPAGAREPQVPATPARPTAPARQLAPARPAATSAFDPDQLVAASSLRGFLAEITLGVRVVLKDRTLLIIFIVSTAFNFFCVPIWDVVLLFFARGDLGLGPIGYGVFSSVQAIGDLVIAFVAAQYYTDARALRFLRICPVAFVAALAIMLVSGFIAGHAPLPVVLVVAAFGSAVLAMMATIFIISRNTIIQKRVREDNLARVFSVSRMTALVALPLGNLAFGFLVAHSGYLGSLTVSIVATALLITVTLGLRVGHRRAGDAAPL